MRLCVVATLLFALAQPAAAAGGAAPGAGAAPGEGEASVVVTAPAERNPLPPAILARMRAKLLALRDAEGEAPAEPAPAGH